jgi:hypothetical protein
MSREVPSGKTTSDKITVPSIFFFAASAVYSGVGENVAFGKETPSPM